MAEYVTRLHGSLNMNSIITVASCVDVCFFLHVHTTLLHCKFMISIKLALEAGTIIITLRSCHWSDITV